MNHWSLRIDVRPCFIQSSWSQKEIAYFAARVRSYICEISTNTKQKLRVPSLSLNSGIFLSVSRTAGTTWSYMCSGGLELSGRLPWCSCSQCSSSRHSLSREAAGGEGAESSGRDAAVRTNDYTPKEGRGQEAWLTCGLGEKRRGAQIQPMTVEDDDERLHQLRAEGDTLEVQCVHWALVTRMNTHGKITVIWFLSLTYTTGQRVVVFFLPQCNTGRCWAGGCCSNSRLPVTSGGSADGSPETQKQQESTTDVTKVFQ